MASRPPESTAPGSDDVARTRWAVIQFARLAGFAVVLVGILVARDVIDLAGASNRVVGYILIALGLVDGFVVPQVLARKWRTPRQ
jgi:hypothetical protein